jgi:hypothetical protein
MLEHSRQTELTSIKQDILAKSDGQFKVISSDNPIVIQSKKPVQLNYIQMMTVLDQLQLNSDC